MVQSYHVFSMTATALPTTKKAEEETESFVPASLSLLCFLFSLSFVVGFSTARKDQGTETPESS